MTSAKQPTSDETNRGEIAVDARIKQEILAAWKEDHPDGTPQQFEETWSAMTAARPAEAPVRGPLRWDEGPDAIKRKLFEEWKAARPEGTMEQFDAAWRAVTAGPDR